MKIGVKQSEKQKIQTRDQLGNDFKFASEAYGQQDNLQTVFEHNTTPVKHYQAIHFDKFKRNLPSLRLCVEHFCPYENQYNTQEKLNPIKPIKFLKPIRLLLVEIAPDGALNFVAITAAGAEHFAKQIRAIAANSDDSKYAIVGENGHILTSSANLASNQKQQLEQSEKLADMLTFTALLNGQFRSRNLANLVNQYHWDQNDFNILLDEIRNVCLSSRDFNIDESVVNRIFEKDYPSKLITTNEADVSGEPIHISDEELSIRIAHLDITRDVVQQVPLAYLANPTTSENMLFTHAVNDQVAFVKDDAIVPIKVLQTENLAPILEEIKAIILSKNWLPPTPISFIERASMNIKPGFFNLPKASPVEKQFYTDTMKEMLHLINSVSADRNSTLNLIYLKGHCKHLENNADPEQQAFYALFANDNYENFKQNIFELLNDFKIRQATIFSASGIK